MLGPYDRYAKLLRQALDIEISTRSGNLRLYGAGEGVAEAQRRIEHLLGKLRKGRELGPRDVEAILVGPPRAQPPRALGGERRAARRRPFVGVGVAARARSRRAPARLHHAPLRGAHREAAALPRGHPKRTLTFGIGVAGTGKTFLAVAAARPALRSGECRRLIMTRPVVEAGEKLGFLPGDVQAKLNPYMRPVYDALFELSDFEDIALPRGDRRDRGRAAGLHARPDAGRGLRDPRRGPEHDPSADEDVPDAPGGGLAHGRHRRSDAERPGRRAEERPGGRRAAPARLQGRRRWSSSAWPTSAATRSSSSVVRAYEGGRLER